MRRLSPLTPAEYELMEVLWSLGEGSVRAVWELVGKRRRIAYTTVMTVLDKMRRKGVLGQTKKGKAFIYTPLETRDEALRRIVLHVAESYFGGSVAALAETVAGLSVAPATDKPAATAKSASDPGIDEVLL